MNKNFVAHSTKPLIRKLITLAHGIFALCFLFIFLKNVHEPELKDSLILLLIIALPLTTIYYLLAPDFEEPILIFKWIRIWMKRKIAEETTKLDRLQKVIVKDE